MWRKKQNRFGLFRRLRHLGDLSLVTRNLCGGGDYLYRRYWAREEVEPAREKAKAMGVEKIYIEDLTEDFVANYVYPMFRANTVYEGEYLLGTSIARPLITRRLVEIARENGAYAVSHGSTGKGNDQVRYELGAYALDPDIKVIAPWREWDLNSREALMDFCEKHQIPVDYKRGDKSPYSMDANYCTFPTRVAVSKTRQRKLTQVCGVGLSRLRMRLMSQASLS